MKELIKVENVLGDYGIYRHCGDCDLQKLVDILFSQETGSFEWAYDKVAGIQRGCMLEIMTRNNSEINDTQSAIDQVTDDASEIISFTCTPFDCSGHGECVNGICNCDTG